MPIPPAPRRIAGIVFVMALWAPGLSARVNPIFQQEIDKVCRAAADAKDAAEIENVDRTETPRFSGAVEAARRAAGADTGHATAQAEYNAAELKRHTLDVDLSRELTPGRAEFLKQRLDDTTNRLAEIRGWESRRGLLVAGDPREVTKLGGQGGVQAEIDRLNTEIAKHKPAAERAHQDAKKEHEDRLAAIDRLHRDKPGVYEAVAAARQRWTDALREQRRLAALADELEETQSAVADCIDRRRAVLDPGSDAARLQRYLDLIESNIAYAEGNLLATNERCRQIPLAIANLNAWVARVDRDARTLSGQSPVDPALVRQHDLAVTEAIDRANRAAAEIGPTRVRATKAAADACAAAQAVTSDPRGPDSAARLAEAQRNREAAEKEVANAAAELERIRAAYAAALQFSAQLAAVYSNPAPAVQGLQAGLASVKYWLAVMQSLVASPRPWLDRTRRAGAGLDWLIGQPEGSPARAFADRHRDRIDALRGRQKALLDAPYCATRFADDVAGASATIAAVEVLINAIPAVSRSPAIRPTQSAATIQGIYGVARGVADGTAGEALKAVRCATAAQVSAGQLGIRCSYKRPDGSDIVVTLYDTQTCPKDIPGRFVDWKPAPKPDMMIDFSGKWVGREPKWEYLTVSGAGNVFSVTYHWQHDARPGATHDWTAECKRDSSTTNADCKGKGKYWDADKTAMYTLTLRLSVQSDGTALHYDLKFDTVETRTSDGKPRDNSSAASPGRGGSNSLRRDGK